MTSSKFSIIGMGVCVGTAEDLAALDKIIFDGEHTFSNVEVSGSSLYAGFLPEAERADVSGNSLLARVVAEAIADTNSDLVLSDCSVILISNGRASKHGIYNSEVGVTSAAALESECKTLLRVENVGAALNAVPYVQDKSSSKAVVIAALNLMNQSILESKSSIKDFPRFSVQEAPTLAYDESNPSTLYGEGAAAIVLFGESSEMPRAYSSVEALSIEEPETLDRGSMVEVLSAS
ncbi:MAG: hypothetical protein JKY24_08960, partial [Pseudomonadales bacterium]|nr:hypothetical protein [Pseudomonadales bacterium]